MNFGQPLTGYAPPNQQIPNVSMPPPPMQNPFGGAKAPVSGGYAPNAFVGKPASPMFNTAQMLQQAATPAPGTDLGRQLALSGALRRGRGFQP